MSPASRPFWHVSAREATAHAAILAVVLWTGAVLLVASGTGGRDRFGTLKGADFVHFYTLGHLALEGRPDLLYNGPAQHEVQQTLVPASASDSFVPVYPPQTALWFAPLAAAPYAPAAMLWAVTNACAYGLAVFIAFSSQRGRLDGRLVLASAAAFPPFWSLVLHGQTTAIPLVAFGLGYVALSRGHRALAGAVLGLAAVKPQLGLMLGLVVIAGGEWRMLLGGALSIAAQGLIAGLTLGWGIVAEYVGVLRALPAISDLLEPKPYLLHSIRALTSLLPGAWGVLAWSAAVALIAVMMVRVWRRPGPLAPRFGLLVLASVLVSPHLTVYDASLLAPAVIWIAGGIEPGALRRPAAFDGLIYVSFPLLLVPTALFMKVQLSVLVLTALFVMAARAVIATDVNEMRPALAE